MTEEAQGWRGARLALCPKCKAEPDAPCVRPNGQPLGDGKSVHRERLSALPRPHVDDAPGLQWRPLASGWEARWKARTDLIDRGYMPKSVQLWTGTELDADTAAFIADRCTELQTEMLQWGRGIVSPNEVTYGGTLRGLIRCYQTDPDSNYHRLRYRTRIGYDAMAKRIDKEHGDELVANINGRIMRRWHDAWVGSGKIAAAHSLVGMMRTLFTFGKTLLEDPECERMSGILHDMRFAMAKPRVDQLTAEQATEVRRIAHEYGYRSIALAQALQFDLMLRQKDVIGEWVPQGEPGISDTLWLRAKWLRGLRWEEIDDSLILRHITSKRQKAIEVDLRMAPMAMEELRYVAQTTAWAKAGARAIMDGAPEPALLDVVTRADLPAKGPVVTSEITALPWTDHYFRRTWRKLAKVAGIPDHVRNMDSRAGAISEATNAGADLEHVRHAATHSDIAMTQRYSRAGAEKVANVMTLRAAHRNKLGTK